MTTPSSFGGVDLILRGGRVIDPANQLDQIADVVITRGKIEEIVTTAASRGSHREQDVSGNLVLPGVIDLTARLREPGEEQKATIASESAAAVAGGISRIVCPPDTWPVVDTPAMANMIRDRAEASRNAVVHPLGALTVGLEGEKLTDMAMLQAAGCVGVSNGLSPVRNTLVMRRAMQYASTYDITVFLSPQDPWLMGNGVVHEGKVSTRLGLPAIPEAAETVGVARDLALIETSGATAHISLISCARSVDMIEEAHEQALPVTASVAIHQLLLSEDDIGAFDTRYKVFPPLRTLSDRDALVDGIRRGVISSICSDHQPHGADAKLAPFSEAAAGIAGIDTLLPLALELAERNAIPLPTLIAALTINPARVIGVDAGHLGVGSRAELCVFDPALKWICDAQSMISRGRNSPFLGSEITGRTILTLVGGEIRFDQGRAE